MTYIGILSLYIHNLVGELFARKAYSCYFNGLKYLAHLDYQVDLWIRARRYLSSRHLYDLCVRLQYSTLSVNRVIALET